MNDIYRPPNSYLGINLNETTRPHRFWRVFFWINAAFIPLIFLLLVIVDDISVYDYIDLIVFGLIFIGLYSYGFEKNIFPSVLWKIACLLYPMWFIFYELAGPFFLDMTYYGEPGTVDVFTLISLLFFVPGAVVLYFLGFPKAGNVHK